MDHLFLGCTIAQDCWSLAVSHNWLNTNIVFRLQLTVLQLLSTTRNASPKINMDRVVALLWSIWKTRNGTVFRNETPNPGLTLTRAKQASAEWRIRHKLTHNIHPPKPKFSAFSHKQNHWVAWRKSQGGFIEINFDDSKSSQGAVGGFIIRNWDGKFIQTSAFNLGASSILIAKAMTMRNRLQVAVQAGYTNIQIEGDNKIVIHVI